MIRRLPPTMGARVYCVGGAKIDLITNLVRGWTIRGQQSLDVSVYRIIIFHVGTNNVGEPLERIMTSFRFLVETSRIRCPGATVYLSGILPRKLDFLRTRPQVLAINQWLEQWAPTQGVRVINAYRLFTFGRNGVAEDLFRDELHLNQDGLAKLADRFRQVLGQGH